MARSLAIFKTVLAVALFFFASVLCAIGIALCFAQAAAAPFELASALVADAALDLVSACSVPDSGGGGDGGSSPFGLSDRLQLVGILVAVASVLGLAGWLMLSHLQWRQQQPQPHLISGGVLMTRINQANSLSRLLEIERDYFSWMAEEHLSAFAMRAAELSKALYDHEFFQARGICERAATAWLQEDGRTIRNLVQIMAAFKLAGVGDADLIEQFVRIFANSAHLANAINLARFFDAFSSLQHFAPGLAAEADIRGPILRRVSELLGDDMPPMGSHNLSLLTVGLKAFNDNNADRIARLVCAFARTAHLANAINLARFLDAFSLLQQFAPRLAAEADIRGPILRRVDALLGDDMPPMGSHDLSQLTVGLKAFNDNNADRIARLVRAFARTAHEALAINLARFLDAFSSLQHFAPGLAAEAAIYSALTNCASALVTISEEEKEMIVRSFWALGYLL